MNLSPFLLFFYLLFVEFFGPAEKPKDSRGKIVPPLQFHIPLPSTQHVLTPAQILLKAESVATAATVNNWSPQQLICIEEEVIS